MRLQVLVFKVSIVEGKVLASSRVTRLLVQVALLPRFEPAGLGSDYRRRGRA